MKKTIWKSILCAVLVTLTACILCTGAFAAKYTCIKSGCTREADKDSAYCWVHHAQRVCGSWKMEYSISKEVGA